MEFTHKITPCLWYDGQAEEAAMLYTSLLPDSRITRVLKSPVDTHSGPAGSVLTVEFTLAGQPFLGLNAGPQFKFNEAVSFQIHCDDQEEVDRLWDALLRDGGRPLECSWLIDKFGLRWQIVPKRLTQLINDPDHETSKKAMQAMMTMVKIDIAKLEAAVRS